MQLLVMEQTIREDNGAGRSKSDDLSNNIYAVQNMIKEARHVTYRHVTYRQRYFSAYLSRTAIQSVLHEHLSARPKRKKKARVDCCQKTKLESKQQSILSTKVVRSRSASKRMIGCSCRL